MQEPKKIRGHGTVEKDKRYKNTWKIRFNTGEKDKQGRYVRSPKRTVHGSKADAYAALEAYIAEYEHSQDPANQTIRGRSGTRRFAVCCGGASPSAR